MFLTVSWDLCIAWNYCQCHCFSVVSEAKGKVEGPWRVPHHRLKKHFKGPRSRGRSCWREPKRICHWLEQMILSLWASLIFNFCCFFQCDILSEARHVKDAISRIVVEIAKREWPQHWPTFLTGLVTTDAILFHGFLSNKFCKVWKFWVVTL